MSNKGDQQYEEWQCGDCDASETAPITELCGETVTETIGEGRREQQIETTVCPECGSDDWHSESIRDLLGEL